MTTTAQPTFGALKERIPSRRLLAPDGTQVWAEVRNGEITNGGLNVIPR